MLDKIKNMVPDIFNPMNFSIFIKVISEHFDQNLYNQILIWKQKPTATLLAGEQCWNKYNFKVQDNEKAIGLIKLDKDLGLKQVAVFDVKQTSKEWFLSKNHIDLETAIKDTGFDFLITYDDELINDYQIIQENNEIIIKDDYYKDYYLLNAFLALTYEFEHKVIQQAIVQSVCNYFDLKCKTINFLTVGQLFSSTDEQFDFLRRLSLLNREVISNLSPNNYLSFDFINYINLFADTPNLDAFISILDELELQDPILSEERNLLIDTLEAFYSDENFEQLVNQKPIYTYPKCII